MSLSRRRATGPVVSVGTARRWWGVGCRGATLETDQGRDQARGNENPSHRPDGGIREEEAEQDGEGASRRGCCSRPGPTGAGIARPSVGRALGSTGQGGGQGSASRSLVFVGDHSPQPWPKRSANRGVVSASVSRAGAVTGPSRRRATARRRWCCLRGCRALLQTLRVLEEGQLLCLRRRAADGAADSVPPAVTRSASSRRVCRGCVRGEVTLKTSVRLDSVVEW